MNAIKHGLACETIDVEASLSPAFAARREAWGAEYRPEGELQDWALDRAVASSFRIERCEREFETVVDSTSERAKLAWHQDRALEAAKLGSRLAKDPAVIVRTLETTYHGVDVLIDHWARLGLPLQRGEDWNVEQAGAALDLLGVPVALRSEKNLIDDLGGVGAMAYRIELVERQVARLEQFQESALVRLEDLEQGRAISGASAMESTPGKLVLRYEREAWKRYRDSIKLLNEPTLDGEPKKVAPPRPVVATPKPQPEPQLQPQPQPTPVAVAVHVVDPFEGEAVMTDAEFDAMMRGEALAGVTEMIRRRGLQGFPEDLEAYFGIDSNPGTNPFSGGADVIAASPSKGR